MWSTQTKPGERCNIALGLKDLMWPPPEQGKERTNHLFMNMEILKCQDALASPLQTPARIVTTKLSAWNSLMGSWLRDSPGGSI